MKLRRSLALLFLVALAPHGGARAAEPLPLEERLARLPRLATIAYVTAHPDDESAAIITYLARGLHARVVILAVTRGEGGQNQDGPELGVELARVRTRELQQAAAGYGAEVRFLGAVDFGYSKSVEETFQVWDEEKVLGALVREIRELRPLVLISHWSGTSRDGGGAHHQAAGMLARRAFRLAGDPQAYPEQLAQGYQPWQPRYLLLRTYSPEDKQAFEVPVKQASPVAGKTYEELGWEAFQNHRSQGLGRVRLSDLTFLRRYGLIVEETLPGGPPAPTSADELAPDLAALPDLFPSVALLAEGRERLAQAVALAEQACGALQEHKPREAAQALVQGAALLAALRREFPEQESSQEALQARAWIEAKQDEFLQAAAALAGVELDAPTDRAVLTPGERVSVRLSVRVNDLQTFKAAGFAFGRMGLGRAGDWKVEPVNAETTSTEWRTEYSVNLPPTFYPPYIPPKPLIGWATLTTGSLELFLDASVRGFTREGRSGPSLETVTVAPALTVELGPPLRLLRTMPGEATCDVWVRVENHQPQPLMTRVSLTAPAGWRAPAPQPVELAAGGAGSVRFSLTVPGRMAPGRYQLGAAAGSGHNTHGLARRWQLDNGTETRPVFEPASAEVEVLDVNVPSGLRVGYIGFNDDPVPALLGQLGVGVGMLDERALAAAALADYDAVVISNRAYDYRADLAGANARLLDYVKAGGALLVEHQGGRWDPARFAPYPATKPGNRNLRVTDETAAVRLLAPDDPLLNFPNRIGPDDWNGWVQERGLYFWESWPEEYTALLEMADPGEEPLRGSLLYARYGRGLYIYTGLALFRQVRAGVPGGVRLYLNLLSQRRAATHGHETRQ